MKASWFLLSLSLVLAPSVGLCDACSDLQAAIAKATALRYEMDREEPPPVVSGQTPARHEGMCIASHKLRDHLVVLARLMDAKCLTEDEQKSLTINYSSSLRKANDNIGLYC